MVRRTKEEAGKTRNRILMSALDTFMEKGYSSTTLTDIAERIGMTRGAFYWHFKDKRDVMLSLAKSMESRGNLKIQEKVSTFSELEDVRKLFVEYARLHVEDKALARFYYVLTFRTEWNSELMEVRDYFQEQQREFIGFVAEVLEHSLPEAQRNKLDLIEVATALYVMVDGLIMNAFNSENVDKLPRQVSDAVGIYIAGMMFQAL